jgi:hypothetical protein
MENKILGESKARTFIERRFEVHSQKDRTEELSLKFH